MGIYLLVLTGFASDQLQAQIDNSFDLYINTFYLHADESEATVIDDDDSGELGLKIEPRLYTTFGSNWRSLVHAQLFYASDTVDLETDEGGQRSDGFAAMREVWFEWSGLTNYPGESIRLGRQRIRDQTGLTLDADIVAARWLWDTTLLQASFGIAEKLDHYRSDDSELPADEQDLRRYLLNARWQYRYQHFISAHTLYTDGDDTSLTQPSLTWFGFSLDNDYFNPGPEGQAWQYYVAGYGLDGEETPLGAIAPVEVSGWAADIGLRWNSLTPSGWYLGIHFTGTDDYFNGFRQTGVHSNRARFSGGRTRLHRFNEALRADLRNLVAGSAYFGFTPNEDWELNLVYSNMQLRNPLAGFYSDNINLTTNGISDEVGQGFDLVATWYQSKDRAPIIRNVELDTYARLRFSTFALGDALITGETDAQIYRATLDWVVKF
jgi:alginate production protein